MSDQLDSAVVSAVGDELRRARAVRGWKRPELVARLRLRMPINTYACYEQGLRPCPVARLADICEVLGISVGELVELALQRAGRNVGGPVYFDLAKVIADTRDELASLRQWAINRIRAAQSTAGQRTVIRLAWVAAQEVAFFCGVTAEALLGYSREFAPDAAGVGLIQVAIDGATTVSCLDE